MIFAYGYSHYGGAGSEVGRVIAHSVIWTTVSQLLRTQPIPVMLVAAALAGLWMVTRHRRARSR